MIKLFIILGLVLLVQGDRYHPHDGKIVGGDETTIEKFPYQVSVRHITSHNCGGTIIDANTIVTAAHCVYGRTRSSSFTILAGTSYINDNTHPGKLGFVDRIIIHEGYNTTSQHNDIALLKLFMPLTFTDNIKPIPLQDEGDSVSPSTIGVVSGWGRLAEGKPNPPGPFVLRKAELTVIGTDECIRKYGPRITDSMFCAQTAGKDSCQGDSGGPFVANGKLIGVVSWGIGCARPEYPGVYTAISELRPWIEKHRND